MAGSDSAALELARAERDEAAPLYESGRRKLADLGVALDPDDQSEMDWLTEQLVG